MMLFIMTTLFIEGTYFIIQTANLLYGYQTDTTFITTTNNTIHLAFHLVCELFKKKNIDTLKMLMVFPSAQIH